MAPGGPGSVSGRLPVNAGGGAPGPTPSGRLRSNSGSASGKLPPPPPPLPPMLACLPSWMIKWFCCCVRRPERREENRVAHLNHPEDNHYGNNFITTSKYSLLSFVPRSLFEQ